MATIHACARMPLYIVYTYVHAGPTGASKMVDAAAGRSAGTHHVYVLQLRLKGSRRRKVVNCVRDIQTPGQPIAIQLMIMHDSAYDHMSQYVSRKVTPRHITMSHATELADVFHSKDSMGYSGHLGLLGCTYIHFLDHQCSRILMLQHSIILAHVYALGCSA